MNANPTSRLLNARSPFLRQHAADAVQWWPFGEAAFEEARRRDVPVLLSVGYAACHWCHAMQRESFEDPATGELLSDFVSVLVDREERPDIDQIYQAVVQMTAGRGGWPLTAFLLPDGRPFYGGTYFPPVARHGLPAFHDVVRAARDAFVQRRAELESNAATFLEGLAQLDAVSAPSAVTVELVDDACEALAERFDGVAGGFGGAPKFPTPAALSLLGRQWHRTGEPLWATMVRVTLDRMAEGGLRDHISGGFHRYCVDSRWIVPHFEKMLGDNALLAVSYLDGWQIAGEPRYREVALETLSFIRDTFLRPDGLFEGSLDSDAGGAEGAATTWTPAEVTDALGAERANAFCFAYGITSTGHVEGGRCVPHLPRPVAISARRLGRAAADLALLLAEGRAELLAVRRSQRPAPAAHGPAPTAWAALAISAFARAHRVLDDPAWLAHAVQSADALWAAVDAGDGRVLRTPGGAPGVLDDHAFLATALLDLYEATGEARWLEAAHGLGCTLGERFRDKEAGGFFLPPDDAGPLVHRPRSTWDQALPSGAAAAVSALLRLALLTGDTDAWDHAEQALVHQAGGMRANPVGFASLVAVADAFIQPSVTVVVSARADDPDGAALLHVARSIWSPGSTILRLDPDDPRADPASGHPLFAGRRAIDGRAAAFVCVGHTCEEPVTEPRALALLLQQA